MFTDVGLSFWGGVDPLSAEVIDISHPLFDCGSIAGKVLCLPNGRGSCTGSQVLLELVLGPGGANVPDNGCGGDDDLAPTAPAAIVLEREDEILGTGLIVAEEVFGRRVPPLVSLDRESFLSLSSASYASVAGDAVATGSTLSEAEERLGSHNIPSNPDHLLSQLELTPGERAVLRGVAAEDEGDELEGNVAFAQRLAMRIVARIAVLQGATRWEGRVRRECVL